jgi:hypothetical protein
MTSPDLSSVVGSQIVSLATGDCFLFASNYVVFEDSFSLVDGIIPDEIDVDELADSCHLTP